MTILTLDNVSKTIQKREVLSAITYKMESGRIYGLQGINGSGKTMLMRLLSGLIQPTAGAITIDGKVLGKDITFPDSLGMLLENPAFLDSYTGFQNLRILASIQKRIGDETIRQEIKRIGLDPDDRRKYRKYSLGMKQRLGIACAIMERPDMVILDEPTNSLDSDGVALLSTIVRQEKERGALVVISCHDFSLLQELSDEIICLEDGRVVRTILEGKVTSGEDEQEEGYGI
jgi:ABC-2 type transport system ATP-binding protein